MTREQTLDLATLRTHRVRGGGGVELHVQETGTRTGQPVLFIHGLSQCGLAWNRQFQSDLGSDLRLVAMDLRGHGSSDHPIGHYEDPSLWADDVHAVITELELDRPVLCGWSYGGVVITDYLRRYGEQAIGGIHLVGAIARLGESVLPYLGPEFLATLPGLFSADVEESVAAIRAFVCLTVSGELGPNDLYLFLGYNNVVPPHVRAALLNRSIDNDDVLRGLRKPVLITHGLEDRVILPTMSEHHARIVPHARTSYYAGIGHTPFWEDASRFNDELHRFASSL